MTTRPTPPTPDMDPAPPSNFATRRAARLAREATGQHPIVSTHVNDPHTAPRDPYARVLRAGEHANTNVTITDVQA